MSSAWLDIRERHLLLVSGERVGVLPGYIEEMVRVVGHTRAGEDLSEEQVHLAAHADALGVARLERAPGAVVHVGEEVVTAE